MTARDDCTAARRAISGMRSRVDDDPTLMLALEGMIAVEEELFPDRAAYEAAAHAETCAACQDWAASWLDVQYPECVAHRARIGKYCCISMFDAVAGPEATVRFSFELFRARTRPGASTSSTPSRDSAHGAASGCRTSRSNRGRDEGKVPEKAQMGSECTFFMSSTLESALQSGGGNEDISARAIGHNPDPSVHGLWACGYRTVLSSPAGLASRLEIACPMCRRREAPNSHARPACGPASTGLEPQETVCATSTLSLPSCL